MATTSRARHSGPDRLTVATFALAATLGMLALLAWQFRAATGASGRPVVTVRRVYETRVVETVPGSGASSVSQSVSSSGSAGSVASTRTS